NWGEETVSMLNTPDLACKAKVRVGNHPNDLVFGNDGRLFVACAGYNTVSGHGRKLYVGVGKGLGSMPVRSPYYIPSLFEGAVSQVDLPDDAGLEKMTAQVLANMPKATRPEDLDDQAKP